MDITPYLKLMVEKDASDIFITVDSPVKIKIEGKANPVGKTVLTGDLTKAAAYGIMNEHQIAQFEDRMECDFAIPLGDDAPAGPDARYGFQVQLVPIGLRGLIEQGHSLGVSNDGGSVKGISEPVEELRFIAPHAGFLHL